MALESSLDPLHDEALLVLQLDKSFLRALSTVSGYNALRWDREGENTTLLHFLINCLYT